MTTQPTQIAFSGVTYTDALLWGGWKWHDPAAAPGAPTVINYYLDTYQGVAWNATQAAAIAHAFQTWSDVANLTFVRVGSAASAQLIERLVPDALLVGALGEHGTPESAAFGDSDGSLVLGAREPREPSSGRTPSAGTRVREWSQRPAGGPSHLSALYKHRGGMVGRGEPRLGPSSGMYPEAALLPSSLARIRSTALRR